MKRFTTVALHALVMTLVITGTAWAQAETETEAESESESDSWTPPNAESESETETETETETASGPRYTFSNSFFTWTNAVTANTFSEGAQLSYDPTYVMTFGLTPRFYLTDRTFLWLNQTMAFELTDANNTTYGHEPLLADTLLDVRHSISWEGFVFQLAGRLAFPLSKASQAANRVLQTGAGLTIVRSFPKAADFSIIATGGYRHWWATTNVPTTETDYPGFCPGVGGVAPGLCNQASGQTTARDIVLGGLILSVVPLPGLTVSASGYYFATYGHPLGDATVPVNGGSVTLGDESPSHWRPFTYFNFAIGYDALPWLNLQLGVQNSGAVASVYAPDGSVQSPFSVDTQIYLSATLGLDGIFNAITESGEDELSPEERLRRRQGI